MRGVDGDVVGSRKVRPDQVGTTGVLTAVHPDVVDRVHRYAIGLLHDRLSAVRATSGQWPDLEEFGQTDKLPGLPWPAVALVWAVSFGVGEEAGWRGWLLPRLAHQISVFWAALIVAGVWIAWHGPAFFFNPTFMSMGTGLLGWMVALVCGSYLLSWLTVGAQWSIVPVVLWHAGFDLLTAADQSAGVFAAAVSTVAMLQGVCSGVILWR